MVSREEKKKGHQRKRKETKRNQKCIRVCMLCYAIQCNAALSLFLLSLLSSFVVTCSTPSRKGYTTHSEMPEINEMSYHDREQSNPHIYTIQKSVNESRCQERERKRETGGRKEIGKEKREEDHCISSSSPGRRIS